MRSSTPLGPCSRTMPRALGWSWCSRARRARASGGRVEGGGWRVEGEGWRLVGGGWRVGAGAWRVGGRVCGVWGGSPRCPCRLPLHRAIWSFSSTCGSERVSSLAVGVRGARPGFRGARLARELDSLPPPALRCSLQGCLAHKKTPPPRTLHRLRLRPYRSEVPLYR